MRGVILPGDRRVEMRECPVPAPGHGQALLKMKASSICGSDIRAIYRGHTGTGAEAYRGVIAGHEPCGQIARLGPGCKRFKEGDRVVVYHISGCGVCLDCRDGYMIGCASPSRAAYGWQRDGGHADYLLADENTLVPLPEPLSYVDGALVACGFGTAYEGLLRARVSGGDRVFITGMGPVGMAVGMLARALGAPLVVGADTSRERLAIATERGAIDHAVVADNQALDSVLRLTDGLGCEVSVDCSGAPAGRLLALKGTRRWGRGVLIGAGGNLDVEVDSILMQKQLSLHGSWVTSVGHMESLVGKLVEWGIRPERIVTDRFPLEQAADAYRLADAGRSGKICLVMD